VGIQASRPRPRQRWSEPLGLRKAALSWMERRSGRPPFGAQGGAPDRHGLTLPTLISGSRGDERHERSKKSAILFPRRRRGGGIIIHALSEVTARRRGDRAAKRLSCSVESRRGERVFGWHARACVSLSGPGFPRPMRTWACHPGTVCPRFSTEQLGPHIYQGTARRRAKRPGRMISVPKMATSPRNSGDQPPAGTTMPGMKTAVSPTARLPR
jgi:hypothetical protein